jgi:hypothetical protein
MVAVKYCENIKLPFNCLKDGGTGKIKTIPPLSLLNNYLFDNWY